MYQREEFRRYFRDVVGAVSGSVNSYVSNLNRVDAALGGLDEALSTRGPEELMAWSRRTTEPPFDTYPANARAALKRYLTFRLGIGEEPPEEQPDEVEVASAPASFFKLEKEMQSGVRSQLERIESGLREVDEGFEVTTSTGRVDILARDRDGKLVAIELKAGVCPPGALEQVLGYAQSLSDERAEPVRAILIASSFPDRTLAAAKRSIDVKLLRYEFLLTFSEA